MSVSADSGGKPPHSVLSPRSSELHLTFGVAAACYQVPNPFVSDLKAQALYPLCSMPRPCWTLAFSSCSTSPIPAHGSFRSSPEPMEPGMLCQALCLPSFYHSAISVPVRGAPPRVLNSKRGKGPFLFQILYWGTY